jgi:hypothetical protein
MQALTKEMRMYPNGKKVLVVATMAGLFTVGAVVSTTVAAGQTPNATPQSANAAPAAVTPEPLKVVAGEIEAKKLLLLMDADRNGKVSRAEFMTFMAAEFDRLDTNKDGELDVKELEKSQLMTVRHGGGHR